MNKLVRIAVLLLVFGLATPNVIAQVTEVWSARYNGTGNYHDGINAMVVDAAGNVYVTGRAYGLVTNWDFCTIKYNFLGDSLWVRTYNGTGNNTDGAKAIAVDKLGNVFVTGESRNGSTTGTEDIVTIKYSPSGDSLWVRRFNGPGNGFDSPKAIGVDDSGNVYVAGGSSGTGTGSDITTIKYNPAGIEQWVKRFAGTDNFGFVDAGTAMIVSDSGYVYVTGYADNLNSFWDYTTIKYDRDGNKLWHASYVGPNSSVTEQANAIAVDASGNVYVTGSSDGGATGSDIVTVKYNSAGTQQWAKRYAGPTSSSDGGNAIAVDASGNVYVCGVSSADYLTIKYNSAGDTLWAKRYNGPSSTNDAALSIAVNASGQVYVTGRSGGATYYNFATIKYAANGDTLWLKRYDGPGSGNDEGTVLRLGANGYIYVAGYSTGTSGNEDFYVVKYSEQGSTNAELREAEIPQIVSLSQNYPNPFNPSTTIGFDLPQAAHVRLRTFDLLGREVATLLDEGRNAGRHHVEWNASKMSSGIYFYRLEARNASTSSADGGQAGSFVAVRKLMLLK